MDRLLKTVPIFAGLEHAALEIFLEEAEKSVVPAGAIIAREGESNHCMFLLGSGSVRIIKHFGEPSQTELAIIPAGDFFGEMCILEPAPRAATAQAIERCVIFKVPSCAFHHLYVKLPAQYGILLLNIARDLSRRLRRLDEAFAARHR
ncbi:MAG TPA: cyclic nucleotide-binding domain-containing protein [Verrucomicrobiae bacterium]|jgi:CRP-like cAMP-binding protein|nr:cyclic nucleotide-binding domain-containing protein [Verrucomicrobiae bacterium]